MIRGKKGMIRGDKGIVTVLVIILMVMITILAVAVTSFVREGLNLSLVKENQTKAIYAARAGVIAAIVDYENNGSWDDETDTAIAGNISYSIGGDGDFLRVDASNPKIGGGGKKLKDVTLYNVNTSDDISMTAITISWDPDSGETLSKINFAGGAKEWDDSASSGEEISLSYTFSAATSYTFKLEWSGGDDITGKTITVKFDFSDGSSRTTDVLVSGSGGDDSFSITSTGKVASNITWKRTIEAGYDVGTSEIVSWAETLNHL